MGDEKKNGRVKLPNKIRNQKKIIMSLNNNVKKYIYSKFKVKRIKISLSLADEKKYSIAFSMIHKWLIKI